jgi:hypothetical protein
MQPRRTRDHTLSHHLMRSTSPDRTRGSLINNDSFRSICTVVYVQVIIIFSGIFSVCMIASIMYVGLLLQR